MKTFILAIMLLVSFSAFADSGIKSCSDLADIVKITAENRDQGLDSPSMLGALMQVGVNPGVAGRIVEWVYNKEPKVTPKAFYKEMMQECKYQAERTRR